MKLMQRVRQRLTELEYTPETINTYCRWMVRFIKFNHLTHPARLGAVELRHYIDHLAGQQVAASTQNQAIAALDCLYRRVLEMPIDLQGCRAKMPKRLPETVSAETARLVVGELTGKYRIMGGLVYGAGLAIGECVKLTGKQIDFECDTIILRARQTMIPQAIKPGLISQVELSARWPGNVEGYVFPSSRIVNGRCWHVSPASLQKEIKKITRRLSLAQRVTPRILRHSFAVHLRKGGYDVRTVQTVMGHKTVKRTMIYQDMVKIRGVVSPADGDMRKKPVEE